MAVTRDYSVIVGYFKIHLFSTGLFLDDFYWFYNIYFYDWVYFYRLFDGSDRFSATGSDSIIIGSKGYQG